MDILEILKKFYWNKNYLKIIKMLEKTLNLSNHLSLRHQEALFEVALARK